MCPLSKNSCAKAFGSWSSSKSFNQNKQRQGGGVRGRGVNDPASRLRVNSGSSTARYNKTSGLMKEKKTNY